MLRIFFIFFPVRGGEGEVRGARKEEGVGFLFKIAGGGVCLPGRGGGEGVVLGECLWGFWGAWLNTLSGPKFPPRLVCSCPRRMRRKEKKKSEKRKKRKTTKKGKIPPTPSTPTLLRTSQNRVGGHKWTKTKWTSFVQFGPTWSRFV